jgi:predicted NBD/HSP70 family sugar kinase
MTSLGIDIGGGSVKAALFAGDLPPRVARSAQYRRPTPEVLRDAVREAAALANGGALPSFDALGICLPGVLNADRTSLELSVHLPELVGVPLAPLIGDALETATPRLDFLSDANATALDVYASRALTGRLLLLAIGTGVGASVIDQGGTIVRVVGDSPGHFGQIDVSLDADPPLGPDGGAGGLEAYMSASSLVPAFGPDPLTAASSLQIADPPLRALTRAIRIAHAIYRPNHVCLAGGIGVRLRHIVPALHEAVAKNLTSLARPNWTLSVADDEFHAAKGAARWAARVKG